MKTVRDLRLEVSLLVAQLESALWETQDLDNEIINDSLKEAIKEVEKTHKELERIIRDMGE
jgi:hypothetical protein